MKISIFNLASAKGWLPERPVRIIRDYSKEITIALVLAIVAALIVDPLWAYRERQLRQQTLQDNLRALATLRIYDNKNNPIGQASGFFIAPNGLLVTNFHVIKGAGNVIAHLSSGAFYLLRGINVVDEKADIAVLQFDARETPSVRGLGDSSLIKMGDEVFSIGTPNGLEATYSAGAISNPSREIGGQIFIQFSAPISPGSSGGGLFNQEGKVIGITAASENITVGPQTGQAQNLNLAVPINRLKNDLHPSETEELQNSNPGYYYSLGNLADNKKQ